MLEVGEGVVPMELLLVSHVSQGAKEDYRLEAKCVLEVRGELLHKEVPVVVVYAHQVQLEMGQP